MKKSKRRNVNYDHDKATKTSSDLTANKEALIKMEKFQSYTQIGRRSTDRAKPIIDMFKYEQDDEDTSKSSANLLSEDSSADEVKSPKKKPSNASIELLDVSPEFFFEQLDAIMHGEHLANEDENSLELSASSKKSICEAEELDEQQVETLEEERLSMNSKLSLQNKEDCKNTDKLEDRPKNFFEQLKTFIKDENLLNLLKVEEESKEPQIDQKVAVAAVNVKKRVTLQLETPKLNEPLTEISEDDDLLIFVNNDEDEKVREKEPTVSTNEEELLDEIEPEEDLHALKHEQELKHIVMDTTAFLNELITSTVEKCAYIEPKEFLRRNLDKAALMKELITKLAELKGEQKVQTFVNKRVADHFRRKGLFRVFSIENPHTAKTYELRYRDALNELDNKLHQEQEMQVNFERQRVELEQKKALLVIAEQEKLEELEQLIGQTFRNKGGLKQTVIEPELKVMRDVRDEISATRCKLMKQQDTTMTLTGKLRKVEKVSENLYMRHYEHLQNEVQILGKRIEERNSDLKKTFHCYNNAIHIRTHIKEEQAIRLHQIDIQKSMLEQLQEEQRVARKNFVFQKKELQRTRKEIRDLRFQSGIIERPALMLDYDVTVDQIEKTSKNIRKLREKHDEMLRKIAYYEDTFTK